MKIDIEEARQIFAYLTEEDIGKVDDREEQGKFCDNADLKLRFYSRETTPTEEQELKCHREKCFYCSIEYAATGENSGKVVNAPPKLKERMLEIITKNTVERVLKKKLREGFI